MIVSKTTTKCRRAHNRHKPDGPVWLAATSERLDPTTIGAAGALAAGSSNAPKIRLRMPRRRGQDGISQLTTLSALTLAPLRRAARSGRWRFSSPPGERSAPSRTAVVSGDRARRLRTTGSSSSALRPPRASRRAGPRSRGGGLAHEPARTAMRARGGSGKTRRGHVATSVGMSGPSAAMSASIPRVGCPSRTRSPIRTSSG